jgi:Na+/H+ antiporter NhaD/arsenite permease-like protein
MTEFAKLHMGLVVLVKKMSVLINFYCKIPILCQSLAKSAQILLVMSDRTDTFRELRHETGVKKILQESDALVYYF